MRTLIWMVTLLLWMPGSGIAQELPISSPAASTSLLASGLQEAASLGRRPAIHGARFCCNLKGAIVGASIGAGLGLLMSGACDFGAAECVAKTTGALAGLGAAFGAFAPALQRAPSHPARGVGISGSRPHASARLART